MHHVFFFCTIFLWASVNTRSKPCLQMKYNRYKVYAELLVVSAVTQTWLVGENTKYKLWKVWPGKSWHHKLKEYYMS